MKIIIIFTVLVMIVIALTLFALISITCDYDECHRDMIGYGIATSERCLGFVNGAAACNDCPYFKREVKTYNENTNI
jgi:hypothetical protein